MSKQPVHEIRYGLIKASIWQNKSKGWTTYSVSVSRIYKNGTVWKESSRFGRDDLPLLAKVADEAHTWIFRNGRRDCAFEENQRLDASQADE